MDVQVKALDTRSTKTYVYIPDCVAEVSIVPCDMCLFGLYALTSNRGQVHTFIIPFSVSQGAVLHLRGGTPMDPLLRVTGAHRPRTSFENQHIYLGISLHLHS